MAFLEAQTRCLVHYDKYNSSFTVEEAEYGTYYGFTLDGDQLYVEGSTFTIHHNSGKSRGNLEDVIKHLLLVPNARVVVTARTYPALDSTFIKEFYSMFPEKLVRRKNEQKKEITLTNNSELIFRSFDDPTKLKSMNVTKAVIVEASDVPLLGLYNASVPLTEYSAMIPELDVRAMWLSTMIMVSGRRSMPMMRVVLIWKRTGRWMVKNFLLDSGTGSSMVTPITRGIALKMIEIMKSIRRWCQLMRTHSYLLITRRNKRGERAKPTSNNSTKVVLTSVIT